MIRAIKILAWVCGMSILITVGAAVAIFFTKNHQWVPVSFPYPRLSFRQPFGVYELEVSSGVLAAGWLIGAAAVMAAIILLPLYLRRTRQYMKMVKGLEKELVALRNLPFKAPAPLEDLPDEPERPAPEPAEDEGDLLREEAPAP